MSRIAIPAVTNATGATAEVYARVRKIAGGSVPNLFAALGHLAPATLNAVLDAEGALASLAVSANRIWKPSSCSSASRRVVTTAWPRTRCWER